MFIMRYIRPSCAECNACVVFRCPEIVIYDLNLDLILCVDSLESCNHIAYSPPLSPAQLCFYLRKREYASANVPFIRAGVV